MPVSVPFKLKSLPPVLLPFHPTSPLVNPALTNVFTITILEPTVVAFKTSFALFELDPYVIYVRVLLSTTELF